MKKTIILNKGGLDAVATARNIIMELYSTLKKWRLGSLRTPPPELIGNVFKNGSLALAAPPIGCGKQFQIKAVWLISV